MNFNYAFPTELAFGPGKVATIGEYACRYGSKALVVTGKNSTKKTGLLARVKSYLEEKGIEVFIFDEVESNPTTDTAHRGATFAKEKGCHMVVGLGGGSSIDAAKGIAFMAVNEGDVSEYIFGKQGTGALPVIAVTTTAGTGSEADSLAVLTNPQTMDKKSLKTKLVYPKVAIVDPELMITLPKRGIAATGIDAFSHSMEAYLSNSSNPVTEALALQAIELVGKNLLKVYKDPSDVEAWCGMAMANTFGGMVIDSAGVILPHGLEHPVSGLLNVTHGEGLAAVMLPWMKYTIGAAPKKFKKIAEVLGEDTHGMTEEEGAEKCLEAVSKLLKALNLELTLGQLGVKEEHVDWLTDNALRTMTYAIGNNPRVANREDIEKLYLDCI